MIFYKGNKHHNSHTGDERFMFGKAGSDVLTSTSDKFAFIYGGKGNDILTASDHGSEINGGRGKDQLHGGDGDDLLKGGAGRDSFWSSPGADVYKGGKGADTFHFRVHDADDKPDLVKDFIPGIDKIKVAGGFDFANLDPDQFVVGTAALDANDRIIYDDQTGRLYADHDGAGGDDPVLLAILKGAPVLTYHDVGIHDPLVI